MKASPAVGNYVLVTAWHDGSEKPDLSAGPNVGCVTHVDKKGGAVTLRFFYRPSQTFKKKTQQFFQNEVSPPPGHPGQWESWSHVLHG